MNNDLDFDNNNDNGAKLMTFSSENIAELNLFLTFDLTTTVELE